MQINVLFLITALQGHDPVTVACKNIGYITNFLLVNLQLEHKL